MAHEKVYGFCDAKCKVEVPTKVELEQAVEKSNQAMATANAMNDKLSGKLDVDGTAQRSIADANGRNIISTYATKDELDRVTPFNSYAEWKNLVMRGKRGDSFVITIDFVGALMGADYSESASDIEFHAFGFFSLDQFTIENGEFTDLEAFGSGEIQGNIDGSSGTEVCICTGVGTKKVFNASVSAFRGFVESRFNYFVYEPTSITSCSGYYVSN